MLNHVKTTLSQPGALLLSFMAFLALGMGISALGFYANANRLENSVKAQVEANRATYDKMWKSVAESAQVPKQYSRDFHALLEAETDGKFGEDGSTAMAQWFHERDLKPPANLYANTQVTIAAGREEVLRGLHMLSDRQRKYSTLLQGVGGKLWADVLGFPREVQGEYAPTRDLDGDGRITVLDYPTISSAKTDAVFASGQDDEPMQVFE
jgi:hypothetical protein